MIKRIITTTIFSILVTSCSNIQLGTKKIGSQIIASSHSSHMVNLTSNEFDQWLADKKQLLLSDRKLQIESYFVEDFLYRNNHLLNQNLLDKIYFLNKANLYSKSINIVKKQIFKNVKVDENEIQQRIHMIQQGNNLKTDKVRLYQIYKKYPPNASNEEKQLILKKMQLIRAKITDLKSFKKFALLESDSQTRLNGGLLGNVTDGKFKGKINSIVMKMQANEVSEIINGTQGVLLFYCKNRIPPKIKTLKQISENVIKINKDRSFSVDYKNKIEQTLNNLEIEIDWQRIYENSPNKTVVISKNHMLTNIELTQLIPNKNRNKVSKKAIESKINNYLVNQALYSDLKNEQQKKLSKQFHYKLKQAIASSVLAKIITKQLKIPTDDDLKKHYFEYKHTYKTKSYYDISAIAFKLTNGNKSAVYNLADNVLNQLQQESISFEEASLKYSFLNEKYNNGYLGKFTKSQIPSAIGINATKQITVMNIGEISKPVETDSSILWIFKLNEIELPRLQSYSEVKQFIDNQLGNERTHELELQIVENIIIELKINLE